MEPILTESSLYGRLVVMSWPVNRSGNRFLMSLKARSSTVQAILDVVPCAVAVWSPDRTVCRLNDEARRLTGFSDFEFQEDPSLWMRQIHGSDRALVSAAWEKLLGGSESISCDYRFSPKSSDKQIWLRELSRSHPDARSRVAAVTSTYINVTDLQTEVAKNQAAISAAELMCIVDGAVHETQNNLQIMRSALDLWRLSQGTLADPQPLIEGVEHISKSVGELREYCRLSDPDVSNVDLAVLIEEIVDVSRRQGIRLRVRGRICDAAIRLDRAQFRGVLEKIIEVSRILLAEGGELEIETEMKQSGLQRCVELRIVTSSSSAVTLDEKDVFQPFLRVNGRPIGLAMALAYEILRRHRGRIFFHKESPRRSVFQILLEAY